MARRMESLAVLGALESRNSEELARALKSWGGAAAWRDADEGRSILSLAVETGQVDLVRQVVEAGVPVGAVRHPSGLSVAWLGSGGVNVGVTDRVSCDGTRLGVGRPTLRATRRCTTRGVPTALPCSCSMAPTRTSRIRTAGPL